MEDYLASFALETDAIAAPDTNGTLTDGGQVRRLRAGECSGSAQHKTIKMVIHHDAARTALYGTAGVFSDGASLMTTVSCRVPPNCPRSCRACDCAESV